MPMPAVSSCWAIPAGTISRPRDWRSSRATRSRPRCSSRIAACAKPSSGACCLDLRSPEYGGEMPTCYNSFTVLSRRFRVKPRMPSKTPKATLKPADFASLYDSFQAPVSRYDCGRKCAPLNGGEPVCCSTQNAVPVVHKVEFEMLKTRSDLWKKFKPYDYATKQIV